MPPRAADVQNVKPDVFYMQDENGELVLVPDFSWEEFQRLLLQDLKLQGPAPPPFVLEHVTLKGTAEGAVAQLAVRFELQLTRKAEKPVRIPLQLANAILQDSTYEGPGEAILAYDDEASSYICWLRGDEQSSHVISLNMAVRLRQIGDDMRLDVRLPDASTHVELTVPSANAEVRTGNEQYVVKPTQATPQGGSLITVDGLGGELRLDWHSGQRTAQPEQPLINAGAEVLLTVDPNYLLAEVQLEVRAERGTLSTFHVQLPPGMKLRPGEAAGYTLEVENAGEEAADTPQIVRVDLANTGQQAASIQFDAAATRSSENQLAPFETAGFTVREAFHQRTDLFVAVAGDYWVKVVEMQNVRRAGGLTDADRQRGVVSKFVYYQNPTQENSLKLAVQAQESLVTIEPTYVLRVREQHVRLDAIFNLHVRGAAARNVPLRFADWSLIDIQPAELVPSRPEILGEGDVERVLIIPLDDSRLPREQTFQLRLSADREIAIGGDKVGIDLPVPRSGPQAPDQTLLVAPATVVVVTAENLELQPLTSEMPDLYTASRNALPQLPPDLTEAIGDREPLVLQSGAASEAVRLVTRVRRRPQTITARSEVTIRIEQPEWEVRQKLLLNVAHQPLQTIPIDFDPQLVQRGRLMATQGDEVLAITPLTSATTGRADFFLSIAPRTGPIEIVFTYRMTPPAVDEQTRTAAQRVPLVTLADDLAVTRASTEVTLHSDGPWQGLVDGHDWTRPEAAGSGAASATMDRQAAEVIVRVAASSEAAATTTIHEAWIQSIFAEDRRLDRAVFRISTAQPRVTVQLPERANLDPDSLSVAVDGRRAEKFIVTSDAELQIVVPSNEKAERRVVEVWYSIQPRYPARGDMQIEVAQLQGQSRWARYYWQLVTPADEHLVWDPAGVTAECDWIRKGWYFARRPHQDQASLEASLQAVRTKALPEQVNSYLFSTFGELPPLRLFTASRALVVLFASGAVLLLGLTILYVSWARQPGLLLLLAVAALGLGYAQPTVGLIGAQAAAAGLLMCVLAALIDRLFARPRVAPRAVRSTIVTNDSARLESPPPAASPAPASSPPPLSTTATANYPLDMPSAEVEP